jgi:hypothetical protein
MRQSLLARLRCTNLGRLVRLLLTWLLGLSLLLGLLLGMLLSLLLLSLLLLLLLLLLHLLLLLLPHTTRRLPSTGLLRPHVRVHLRGHPRLHLTLEARWPHHAHTVGYTSTVVGHPAVNHLVVAFGHRTTETRSCRRISLLQPPAHLPVR